MRACFEAYVGHPSKERITVSTTPRPTWAGCAEAAPTGSELRPPDGVTKVGWLHRRAPAPVVSVFQSVISVTGCHTCSLDQAAALMEQVERSALTGIAGDLLVVSLPRSMQPTSAAIRRYTECAERGVAVVVLAEDVRRQVSAQGGGPHLVPTRPDDLILDEWAAVLHANVGSRAFVALEPAGSTPTQDRVLRYADSEEPQVVAAAMAALLRRVPHLRGYLPH